MSLESPRKMQDEQEVMGETAGDATRRRVETRTRRVKRRRWKPKFFGTGGRRPWIH